jgi:hypothetical protein
MERNAKFAQRWRDDLGPAFTRSRDPEYHANGYVDASHYQGHAAVWPALMAQDVENPRLARWVRRMGRTPASSVMTTPGSAAYPIRRRD